MHIYFQFLQNLRTFFNDEIKLNWYWEENVIIMDVPTERFPENQLEYSENREQDAIENYDQVNCNLYSNSRENHQYFIETRLSNNKSLFYERTLWMIRRSKWYSFQIQLNMLFHFIAGIGPTPVIFANFFMNKGNYIIRDR